MKRIHFLSDVRSCADAPLTNYVHNTSFEEHMPVLLFFLVVRLKSFSRMPKTNSIIKYYADTPVIFMWTFLIANDIQIYHARSNFTLNFGCKN